MLRWPGGKDAGAEWHGEREIGGRSMPAVKYGKCQVVAQASLAGVQDVRVRAFGRVDGWTTPYISVRIGHILEQIQPDWITPNED